MLLDRFRARQQVRLQDLQVLLDPGMRVCLLSTVDALAVGSREAAGQSGRAGVDGSAVSPPAEHGALVPSVATAAGTTDPVTSAGSGAGALSLSEALPQPTVTGPSASTEPAASRSRP